MVRHEAGREYPYNPRYCRALFLKTIYGQAFAASISMDIRVGRRARLRYFSAMTLRALVVTPVASLARTLEDVLARADFDAEIVDDGAVAMQAVHNAHRPNMVVVDLALPDRDGFDLCRRLRRDATTADIPIIAVATSDGVGDRVDALESGADDCVTLPLVPDEVLARVRALCRRAMPSHGGHVRAGPIDMDLERWTVTVGDRPVRLTKKEFKLLQVLLEAKGRVLSRDALLEQAWPHSSVHGLDTRTVDVHVGRLRRKLGPAGRHIITVRNVGFRFDVLPEWIAGHPGLRENAVSPRPRRH